MSNITLRSVKGSPLTNNEVDSNFNSLNVYKVELTDSAGSIEVPAGTTAQRDASPNAGYLRYNTDNNELEHYDGSSWEPVGATITTDISEGTNLYYTTARADSDAKSALVAGTGLTYDSASGSYSITNTGVTSGTYGGAESIPVITINDQGQIDSAGTASISTAFTAAVTVVGGVFYIDGVKQCTLSLEPGTFRFDQSDSSNSGHPLKFSETDDGTHGGGSEYTTGVTYVGTPGSAGAYTQIIVEHNSPELYYYCENHSGMGGDAAVNNVTKAQRDSDARAAISVSDAGGDGSLTYSPSTGQLTYTGPSAAETRAHFQVINVSGDGSLAYDSALGNISYTGPSASDTRAHFSGGTGVTITDGEVAIGQDVGTTSDVTFGKITGDSAELNNIVLTRRTTDPTNPFVGGELFFDSNASKNLTFIPRTDEGSTDVAINIGQEEVVYVKNDTGGQISNGEVVNFIGADSNGNPKVEHTLASAPIEGPIGVATMDIPDGAHGFVTTQGLVRGFDTIRQTSGGPFSVGDRAYICNVNPGGFVKHDIGPDSGYPYQLGTILVADSNEGVLFVNGIREHWTRARFSGLVKTSGEVKADGKVTAKAITFDGTTPEYAEGTIFYDSANGAIAFKNDVEDITMQIGQEDWVRVYNNSGSTINNGQPVYINGTQDNFPTIALAAADADATVHAIGLATHNISNGSYGYVTTKGVVNDIDTSFGSAGDKVHVGITAGTLQLTAPTYPNYAVDMGYILTADSAGGGGSILVSIVDHTFETTRTTGDARVDGDMTVGGDLTVLGTQTIAASENISIGGAFNYLNAGDTIGDTNTAFVGSGLDDATLKGHYSGTTSSRKFVVEIDGTGTPDTFRWSHDSDFSTVEASGVAITGSEQDLAEGIKVEFVATTGHDSGDRWTGTASPVNVDTGWFSNRNTGTSGVGYTHLGMFFDASTQKFTLVDEYYPEPEGAIDTTDSSISYGILKAASFEGNLTGAVTGNATTASTLQTGRTIGLTGDVTATGVSFNGGSNITLTTAIASGSIVNADINSSAAIADTKLATISTAGKVQNSATTATAANTGSAIVTRDASGNFSAGTITASLTGNVTGDVTGDVTGNATTADSADNATTANNAGRLTTARTIGGVSFDGTANINLPGVNTAGNQNTSGNAASADSADNATFANNAARWTTGRTIALTGDVTGTSGSFDGTGNLSFATTIANNSVALGTQTTGNYVDNVTGGTGITVTHTPGEGSEPSVAITNTGVSAGTYGSATAIPVISVNAQGQIDSASTTSITVGDGTLTLNTSGTGISGSQSFTANQSGNATFTVTSNATNANTASTIVARDGSGNFSAGTITAALSGNATSADSADNATTANNAGRLTTARTIGGVSFDGTSNINLPGVNTAGNQNTSGNAATATALATARTIGGVSFDGTANINLPGVNTTGNQNTSGNAASATVGSTVTLTADNSTNATNYITFVNAATGNLSPRTDTSLTYNPSTNTLSIANLSGNASTATSLATARTIGGVSFDGTANINLPGVNTTGNQNTSGNAATATALANARTIAGQSFDGTANISIAPTDLTSVSATASEINILDGATLTTTELNKLDGVTASTTELNKLDGLTATTTELNYVDGVTSAIQTQLDAKLVKSNNLSDLTNASTARTNLGLGSLATLSAVGASQITDNTVGAAELNVSGNGNTSQFLRSDGDGTFSWATPTDTNTTYSAGDGLNLSGTTFSHSDTSSQSSVNNSGRTYIQDITLDTYGHITGITSATETVTNTTDWRVQNSGGTEQFAVSATEGVRFAGSGASSVSFDAATQKITISSTDTNTTYSVGDGGLTQKNFTTALKSKLDGIESGATADQTASEILTKIKTVDGASSGLDADLLDGQHGSYYRINVYNSAGTLLN